MHFNLLILLILIGVNVAVGWYIYREIVKHCNRKWLRVSHFTICGLTIAMALPMGFIAHGQVGESTFMLQMWLLIGYLSITCGQIIFVLTSLLGKTPLLVPLIAKILRKNLANPQRFKEIPYTRYAGATLGIIVFLSFWWGALINRYNIDVEEVTVEIPDLSAEFNGYRIVQISDLHLGTYNGDTTYVAKVVDRINSLSPDLIVFTGDIVNRHSSEAEPFMATLSRLKATDGQFAILGNHDYADYFYAPEEESKKDADRQHLKSLYAASTLRLLCDEHVWIHRGNDSIALIGVENIGVGRFPKYGSLEKAYPDINDDNVKILLSHDPAHWETEIRNNTEANVALTLSGHTHAMQISILGFSPASFVHENYRGLTADANHRHQLYVNIGIGTVGTPMRIGATPEITVITLKTKQ